MPPLSTSEHVVKLAMHPAGKLLAGITDKCKSSYDRRRRKKTCFTISYGCRRQSREHLRLIQTNYAARVGWLVVEGLSLTTVLPRSYFHATSIFPFPRFFPKFQP